MPTLLLMQMLTAIIIGAPFALFGGMLMRLLWVILVAMFVFGFLWRVLFGLHELPEDD